MGRFVSFSHSQHILKTLFRALYTHFEGEFAAALSDKPSKPLIARLVGAMDHEVSVMNSLSVNLVLMGLGFYNPSDSKYNIVIEKGAFPSDRVFRVCFKRSRVILN